MNQILCPSTPCDWQDVFYPNISEKTKCWFRFWLVVNTKHVRNSVNVLKDKGGSIRWLKLLIEKIWRPGKTSSSHAGCFETSCQNLLLIIVNDSFYQVVRYQYGNPLESPARLRIDDTSIKLATGIHHLRFVYSAILCWPFAKQVLMGEVLRTLSKEEEAARQLWVSHLAGHGHLMNNAIGQCFHRYTF